MKKLSALLLAFAMMLTMISAASADDVQVIRMWSNDQHDQSVIKEKIEEFNATMPAVSRSMATALIPCLMIISLICCRARPNVFAHCVRPAAVSSMRKRRIPLPLARAKNSRRILAHSHLEIV